MLAEVHRNKTVMTQLEHWQTIILPCETDHGIPVENPALTSPPKELSVPNQHGAMQPAVHIRTPFLQWPGMSLQRTCQALFSLEARKFAQDWYSKALVEELRKR